MIMYDTSKMMISRLTSIAVVSSFLLLGACATTSESSSAVTNLEKPAQTLSENLVLRMGDVHKVKGYAGGSASVYGCFW